MFQSAKSIFVIDPEEKQLLQHNEDMSLRSTVPLQDVTECAVKDRTKPLLLHLEFKGKGKESKIEFKDEEGLNRFIELVRASHDDYTTRASSNASNVSVRSDLPDRSQSFGAAEGQLSSMAMARAQHAWPSNARIAMTAAATSGNSSISGSHTSIHGLRPSDVPIKNSFLRRAHTSQPGQSMRNGIISGGVSHKLTAVDENTQVTPDLAELNGHHGGTGNGWGSGKGLGLSHISEQSATNSFKQQRLRHEESLKKDYQSNTPIHRYDPTDLFCGNKTIATVSAGMVVVAYPKAHLTGRAAIKQLRVGTADSIEDLMSEVYAMSVSNHPNIIDFFNSYLWTDSHGIQNLWIVMEFMPYGSLTACLEDAWDEWSERPEIEEVAAYVVREVATGLAYLHSYNRLHRDIKSDNIFVGIGGIVKIGDLGCCVHLTQEKQKRSEMQGTANWMAPECIMQKPYDSKIDVWSLGVTLMEMCQRDPPYFDETVYQAMYLICKHGVPELNEPERWSDELKEFLKVCTKMDPAQRIATVDLLENPWFEKAVEPEHFEQVVRECLHLPKMNGERTATQLSREHLLMLKRSGTV